MPSPRTLLCVPTYNEVGNVEPLCEGLFAQKLDLDILFMDDASPDGTGQVIDRLAATRPRVIAVHRPGKLGIGSAHLDCIRYGYEHGYDVVLTMDCDFTHPPEYVSALIAASEGHDVVIGSRYLLQGSLDEWSPFRRVLTYAGHCLTTNLLKLPHDASSGLRLYVLRRIPRELFDKVDGGGYSFFFESLFLLANNGFEIAEVGIHLPARSSGQSKMGVNHAVDGLVRLGRMWVRSMVRPERYRIGR
jgi:dolichol-phosphate mannosyltransferase